ncbi:PaaI family thioesterase [Qingshengfaniella alkalisoli]|uniref:PaaI family thioesterase n=1 Tax=Qingshengfaniella alkalisoli TaxID=2599296 RepID=A0A5B8IUL3_9RHOB|nr:PaaI family thioesterase [Qingshengfaniella alkalisoli]QDY68551.1 PaaI family thioesterase [Qingshengfaniella alkalisoli]
MSFKQPEPVQVVKERRDAALHALVSRIPFTTFLGVQIERKGDELTSVLPFDEKLIGNPELPALHGGATAGFLEVTAIIQLCWSVMWEDMENSGCVPQTEQPGFQIRVPKTIDFTVDYLRSGLPRDAYARARVNRSGRRYASVHVEGWQDNQTRPFAQATGHFLMPPRDG